MQVDNKQRGGVPSIPRTFCKKNFILTRASLRTSFNKKVHVYMQVLAVELFLPTKLVEIIPEPYE